QRFHTSLPFAERSVLRSRRALRTDRFGKERRRRADLVPVRSRVESERVVHWTRGGLGHDHAVPGSRGCRLDRASDRSEVTYRAGFVYGTAVRMSLARTIHGPLQLPCMIWEACS